MKRIQVENIEYAGGLGTVGDPYVITTAAQLSNVRTHLDSHFVLNSSIDLDADPCNTGSGWLLIGTFDSPFTGTFEGNGKEIDGLFINRGDTVGLFGSISGSADIRYPQLTNLNITGVGNVGALVGNM